MLNKKEISAILVTTIVLAFAISLLEIKTLFLPALISIFIIIMINIVFKKMTSEYLDSKIEIKMWEAKQFWFRRHDHLKKPVPIGLFLPIVLKIITAGALNWTASLVFDVKAKIYRTAKRHGLYAFSEMSEAQIGAIAGVGIAANLLGVIVGYLAGFSDFARLSLGFVFFNMLPIANLDGNKIFFGSRVLWVFLALITLVGIIASFFIV